MRAAVAALAMGWTGTAFAQLPEGPYATAGGRIIIAGEISATVADRDPDAYFNYTDYKHDALRMFRGRLFGQWRASSRVSLLAEMRVENRDELDAPALYLRWRPWAGRDFDIQAGRIPPVIGAWIRHAYGRDNLVIGLPLGYQYLTSLRPDALPATADDLLRMRARGWRPAFPIGSRDVATGIPLVTASHWATGAQAHWRTRRLDLAGAVTLGAPAVAAALDGSGRPGWSGRAGVTAAPGLEIGVSAARGRWIETSVLALVPEATRQENAQTFVGADAEFGRGRLLVRAEWMHARFEVPALSGPPASPLGATTGFVEARYRWHPRWQAAVRAERLTFSAIAGSLFDAAPTPWDAPVTRWEAALGYRAARNLEARIGVQHDEREAGRVRRNTYPAAQLLYWF